MQLRPPLTHDEWEDYYALRFSVLREPWQQERGTERLSDDPTAVHLAAYDKQNKLLGVARMHTATPIHGQVRCVAVAPDAQGLGVGKALMKELEDTAKKSGLQAIQLEARENAVPFYRAIGYDVVAVSYLLFGEIQHYTMMKFFDS